MPDIVASSKLELLACYMLKDSYISALLIALYYVGIFITILACSLPSQQTHQTIATNA